MNVLTYYLRDAREGIRRNAGAAVAMVLLIFITLSITGSAFLLKSGADDLVRFLQTQVKLKVFLEPGIPADQMAAVLKDKSYVTSVQVVTGAEALQRLKPFFAGRDYLLNAFSEDPLPDSVEIELKDKTQMAAVAAELKQTKGVQDVVYAQSFAQAVLDWSHQLNLYGGIILAVLLGASLLTVYIAINLALYQRQKEIRVKLLLGARESHVRGQFLLEGLLLGLIGSILASFTVYLVYQYGLFRLQESYGTIFRLSSLALNLTLLAVVLGGALIGVAGSLWSTRKLMRNG